MRGYSGSETAVQNLRAAHLKRFRAGLTGRRTARRVSILGTGTGSAFPDLFPVRDLPAATVIVSLP